MAVHKTLKLHITNEKYYLESQNASISETLVIDRLGQDISLLGDQTQIPPNTVTKDIYGIVGIIRLTAGSYLVVITKKTKVGDIHGQDVWRVTATEVLPFKRTTMHLTEQQLTDNKSYLAMVEQTLSMDSYYFSTSYDLTQSMQRLNNTSPDYLHMPMYERADTRFVWNGHLMRDLTLQHDLHKFCMPLMLGFVTMRQCLVDNKSFKYILISRRQCLRAGVRYYMRGLDSEGHVANFVETEQIIEYDGKTTSIVQTRGSLPFFWSQRPNLKYKPDPIIDSGANHLDGFQRHFASQIYNYGKQVIVNLLDHKGKENVLVKMYAKSVQDSGNDNIRYEAFDFHHECHKMQWHRLSILVSRLELDRTQFKYFSMNADGSVSNLQEGVFRTNCIDCLDRTNVVQSLIARQSLQDQLQELGILQEGQRVEDQTTLEYVFKNVWADNADACAKQYAGTGALKTDFTRTGKRTKWGLVQDGVNSACRYFINNFYDGFRQDSMDLFLGNHVVEEDEGTLKPSPFRHERARKFYILPTAFIVALSMCIVSILVPDEHPIEQVMFVLVWGSMSAVSALFVFMFGRDFVDKPKLCQSRV